MPVFKKWHLVSLDCGLCCWRLLLCGGKSLAGRRSTNMFVCWVAHLLNNRWALVRGKQPCRQQEHSLLVTLAWAFDPWLLHL
jgi:hypothetical protein